MLFHINFFYTPYIKGNIQQNPINFKGIFKGMLNVYQKYVTEILQNFVSDIPGTCIYMLSSNY